MPGKKKLSGMKLEDILELRKSDMKLKCITCGEEKPISKFSYGKSSYNGLFYQGFECGECRYKRKVRVHGKTSQAYLEKQRHYEDFTISGRASQLRGRCKQRAKRCGYEFNLSKDVIIEKLSKMRCEATGITLILDDKKYNPYSPSIDRIDSAKGYTDDNIQITCVIYNFCKNQFSEAQTQKFLQDARSNGIHSS
jgi:hypothetical protein